MRIALFPYSLEDYYLYRYRSCYCAPEDELLPVSPQGAMTGGMDIGAPFCEETGLLIRSDHRECLSIADRIVFLGQKRRTFFAPDYADLVADAASLGKILAGAEDSMGPTKAIRANHSPRTGALERLAYTSSVPPAPNVPVVLVCSTVAAADTLQVLLAIRRSSGERGMRTWPAASSPCSSLFCVDDLLSPLMRGCTDDATFVHRLREAAIGGCAAKRPDAMVLGLPGRVLPLSRNLPGDYGFLHRRVAAALQPRGIILLTTANHAGPTEISSLAAKVEATLLSPVLCAVIASIHVDYALSDELGRETVCHVRPSLAVGCPSRDGYFPSYGLWDPALGDLLARHLER